VGYSRTAVYVLPAHVRAFLLKPTLLYLYGLQLDEVQRVAAEVRGIRAPNPYTGNGIQYVDEVVKLKQRAASK
jgi:large subunit ribosomal protein L6